jgi:FdhE protein
MKNAKWDARIKRAAELASSYPFAAEGLRFYQHVTEYQRSLYSYIESESGSGNEFRELGMLRRELDLFLLLPKFGGCLAALERCAPSALAGAATEFARKGASYWQDALTEAWRWDGNSDSQWEPPESLLAWIFLQPYAEYLADHSDHPPVVEARAVCPMCGRKPIAGVLRPEGDGGKRRLVCSLCATEWDYRRIVCPSCGEEDVKKLAVYNAEQFTHARVEACDTCKTYIKTIDMTKDGRAVPVVDELATIPLNLWASEHGYKKLQTNLLGI